MKKLFAFVFAAGISFAGLAVAQTMPVTQVQSAPTELTTLVSSVGADRAYSVAHYRRHHRVAHYARVASFPYYPSRFNISGFDAGEDRFCAFGSYVACPYAGVYCWRRCY